jgi:subtilisin family serine protease
MMKKNKNSSKLLPFIREDVFGLSPQSVQIYGWEIKKFNIQNHWINSQGENTKVAVIDTGCDLDHPDIKNNLLQGINLIDNKKDPIDDNGHGTHVAGTIAGENNGIGMVGVAPKCKIIPIKTLDENGNGGNKAIAAGIVWAADRDCDFITMSLGTAQDSKDIHKAIIYATKKGCIIFCAAGNSGENTPIMYPARYNETIAIGSIDRNLRRSDFTCAGEELEFLSPGQDIFSCVPDNSYAVMSGTSMATPFAVGCACLLLSFYKKKNKQNELKSKEDYVRIFKESATSLSDKRYAGEKKYEGYGILNPKTV